MKSFFLISYSSGEMAHATEYCRGSYCRLRVQVEVSHRERAFLVFSRLRTLEYSTLYIGPYTVAIVRVKPQNQYKNLSTTVPGNSRGKHNNYKLQHNLKFLGIEFFIIKLHPLSRKILSSRYQRDKVRSTKNKLETKENERYMDKTMLIC